jgi:hypothetical protein
MHILHFKKIKRKFIESCIQIVLNELRQDAHSLERPVKIYNKNPHIKEWIIKRATNNPKVDEHPGNNDLEKIIKLTELCQLRIIPNFLHCSKWRPSKKWQPKMG